jgi:isocitrate dehydrogenase kinase/phosphatase
MQLKSELARRSFRKENADLLSVDYWQDIQRKLKNGEVPEITSYPRATVALT